MRLKKFIDIVNENIGETHLQRFNRAIYLTYVGHHEENEFKKSSKEEFENKIGKYLETVKTVQFDKNRIYRLADEKKIWYSKNGTRLGEIFVEFDEDTNENIESYWINVKFK